MAMNVTEENEIILANRVEQVLLMAKKQCECGYYFPEIIFHLNNQMHRLRQMPEFKMLENSENILKPLVDFAEMLQYIDLKMQNMFDLVCKQAKPGVVVENFIIYETNALNKAPIFEKFVELGAKTMTRYINNKENIKKIHQLVIHIRVDVCKEIIKNTNDFYDLQTEIKKITHYRVRRNVLSALFEDLVQDDKFFLFNYKKKEQCLFMLQQEYLYAIYRQIENMVLDKAIPFLSKIQHDPIFKPLPKRKWFSNKNNNILNELQYLLMHSADHVLKKSAQSEPPSLYHIDSPIEQDIIGEITRRLANSIQYNSPRWQSFNTINEIMERTYKLLIEPDFEPEQSLEDLIIDSKKHNQLILILMNEKKILFRLDRIIMLYHFIKDKPLFKKTTLLHKLGVKKNEKEKAVSILQACYLQSLNELPHKLLNLSEDEKIWWHECFLNEALHSELFNSIISPKSSRKALLKLKTILKKRPPRAFEK